MVSFPELAGSSTKLSNFDAGLIVAGMVVATAAVMQHRWFGRTYWRLMGRFWGRGIDEAKGVRLSQYAFLAGGLVMYAIGLWLLFEGS